jgi:hypothetical protein
VAKLSVQHSAQLSNRVRNYKDEVMDAERDSRNITGVIRAYGGSALSLSPGQNAGVQSPGIYVIYFVTDSRQGTCLPFYCGFTSRSIRQRLYEHSQPGGQIYKMRTLGGVETNNGLEIATAGGEVYVGYIECQGMLGKLIESSLLLNYDFLLNASENGQRRLLDVAGLLDTESTWDALTDTDVARTAIGDSWNDGVENTVNEAIDDARMMRLYLEQFRGLA